MATCCNGSRCGVVCGRCGALSFGSRHADGKYHDHMGITQAHDTLSEVSVHHETGSLAATGGSANGDRLASQLGQDAIIYKMSDAGMPAMSRIGSKS